MPRLPRNERRHYTPRIDFDRPAVPRPRETVEELLHDIPQKLWDQPAFDGQTPRQVAQHVHEGEGCPACRCWLDDLRASRPCALCGHYKSSHGYGLSLYPCGAWDQDDKCTCPGYEPEEEDDE